MLRRIAGGLGPLLSVVGGIFSARAGDWSAARSWPSCSQTVSIALIRGVPAELAWTHAAAVVRRAASDHCQRGRSRPRSHRRVLVVGRGRRRGRCRGVHFCHAAKVVAVRGCSPSQRNSTAQRSRARAGCSRAWALQARWSPRPAIEPPITHPYTWGLSQTTPRCNVVRWRSSPQVMPPSAGVPAEAAGDLNSHTAVRSGRFRGRSTPLRPRSGGLLEWRGVGAPYESEQLRQRNRFLPKNNPRITVRRRRPRSSAAPQSWSREWTWRNLRYQHAKHAVRQCRSTTLRTDPCRSRRWWRWSRRSPGSRPSRCEPTACASRRRPGRPRTALGAKLGCHHALPGRSAWGQLSSIAASSSIGILSFSPRRAANAHSPGRPNVDVSYPCPPAAGAVAGNRLLEFDWRLRHIQQQHSN